MSALKLYDDLPPQEAVIEAWTKPGHNPQFHEHMRESIRMGMPLLGRALDRLSGELADD